MFGKQPQYQQPQGVGYGQQMGQYGNPYYINSQIQRMQYEIEQNSRQIRNLRKRVRRVENYLGIRKNDIEQDEFDNDLE
ncbi:hypothetical protein RJG79_04405 [Mycoplasmatota bacterium WC44]